MNTVTEQSPALQAADVLDRAAAHLDRVGHFKGYLYDEKQAGDTPLDNCRVCAAGAILAATYGEPRYPGVDPEINLSDRALFALEEKIGSPVASWNDEPRRQKRQVVKALRDAAATLRAEAAK